LEADSSKEVLLKFPKVTKGDFMIFYEGWINKGKIFNKMPDGFPFPPEAKQFFQLIQMSKPGLSGSKYTGRAAAAAVGDESQLVQLRCCDLEMISKMGDEAPNLWQKQE